MVDTFTPADNVPTFFDVNFFPLFQSDFAREVSEHGVRSGGGTKPIGQEQPYEPGSTARFVRDGTIRGDEIEHSGFAATIPTTQNVTSEPQPAQAQSEPASAPQSEPASEK